jgi:succinate dehydrogenase / fumarate reductase cytochrome b subunit
MSQIKTILRSTVGRKFLMALSGVALVGFVISHMVGNLKIFQGPEKLNHYAEFLREMGDPFFSYGQLLWLARIGLLVGVGVHIWAAVSLTRAARRARVVPYQRPVHLEDTYASRTMRWGGVIITAFVIYHLMHMTWGNVHGDFIAGDVYHNMIVAFQVPVIVIAYAVAMGMLGFHLYHGIWSTMQTLGANHGEINPYRRGLAGGIAVVVVMGFLAPPLAVLFGVVS